MDNPPNLNFQGKHIAEKSTHCLWMCKVRISARSRSVYTVMEICTRIQYPVLKSPLQKNKKIKKDVANLERVQ